MTTVFLVILTLATGILGAYTLRFRKATLFWAKQIDPNDSLLTTALQDAMTPKTQTVRNITFYMLLGVVFAYGLVSYSWFLALAFVAVILFPLISLVSAVLPKVGSGYYLARICEDLFQRHAEYEESGDTEEAEAIRYILSRIPAILLEDPHGTVISGELG